MRDADGRARELLDALFASETEEDMRRGFEDLSAEMKWRRDEHERIEAEAAKRARKGGRSSGRPRPTRRISQAQLEDAAAAWAKPEPTGG